MTGSFQLTQLGRPAGLPASPDHATLETVPNARYLVRFRCPEFTLLCPVTGLPDFAHRVIVYVPVESKPLELFLGAFRNRGAFHEDRTLTLARRLLEALAPVWLRIGGYWYPRGGMPIDVFYQSEPPPEGVWLPEQGMPPYRARG